MKPYTTLSRRSQLGRLRRLAQRALARYGIAAQRLTPLRHEHNTTWRVDAGADRYVLRIHRPHTHTQAAIASELAWLAALRRDTTLGVPQPVAALDGSLVVQVADAGVPEPRSCVVLHWLTGSFAEDSLTPRHLRHVGVLQASLQEHSSTWLPPAGFTRARIDNLTAQARRDGTFSTAAQAAAQDHPTPEDCARAIGLVAELVSAEDAALVAMALEQVRAATRELSTQPDSFGLIHADLHYENVLFAAGEARAIDFDDCGWGFYLYDLAVTLSELRHLERFDELRAALVDAYARRRSLPERYEDYLHAFVLLRRMQLLVWVLESREHAAFRGEWQAWAREELDPLGVELQAGVASRASRVNG